MASSTLRNRDKVKESLNTSSVYNNIVNVAIEGLANAESQDVGEIPINDPALQEKVRNVLTPDFLKSSTESVIDGVYNWLEGDVAQPDFEIDLSGVRTQLAAELGNYAAERAASLPTCTTVPAQYDALTAECVPPATTTAQIKDTVEQEFLNSDGFFNDAVLTAEDIKDPETQQSIFTDTNEARRLYQTGGYMPYILGAIVLVTAAAILFLSSSRRAGALRLGIISTLVALVLSLTYATLSRGPELLRSAVLGDSETSTNPAGEELVVNVFETFASNSGKLIGLYALLFTLVAVACFVAYASMGKSGREDDQAVSTEPKPPIDDSAPTEAASAPTEEPRPEPKKTRIPPKIQL